MSDEQQKTNPTMEDAYKMLNVKPNSDGSLSRLNQPPISPAIPEIDPTTKPDSEHIALCKDIPLNPTHKTFIRLYRPRSPPPATKIPLIIYFHGGGFVVFSATSVIYHEPCNRMAAHSPAIIASVEYRLAPEHRLPAAYDDAMDAINWVKNQATASTGADPWVKEFGDLSRVFLMGCSAGGNIVYHAALRAADLNLHPVKIVGLIMNQPFFGGQRRTESELKHLEDKVLPPHVTDLMWSLALPEGADRGHVYCNLQTGENHVGKIGRLPASLVREVAGDTLLDWQKEFVKMLESRGVRVVPQFVDGEHHAVEIFDPKFAQAFYDDVRDFICSIGVTSKRIDNAVVII